MRLGYNTNGFAHHRLPDALAVIAELGYRSVGITLDVHHLDPYAAGHAAECARIARQCRDLDLVPVVETGARFLLDARRKHRPTLLSASGDERVRRRDFLARAIDTAAAIGATVVSLWSGSADDDPGNHALDERLAAELQAVCDRARATGVVVGFEPEPGMYIEDMAAFARIRALVEHPALRLTLDVGHAHITEADGAEATVRTWAAEIVNAHVEGMRRGVHDHMVPWEGDLDVRAVLRTLREVGYAGPATLELSRHSHDAVRVARGAAEFLAPFLSGDCRRVPAIAASLRSTTATSHARLSPMVAGPDAPDVWMPVPPSAKWPVELRPPPGFRPDDLSTWPHLDGSLEYVAGKLLYMAPCGETQSTVVAWINIVIGDWIRSHRAFALRTNEVGIYLDGDVRAADIAVWRKSDLGVMTDGLARVPPVLVVEVAGSLQPESDLRDKASWYLDAGVEVVWLVLPRSREAVVMTTTADTRIRGSRIPEHASLPGLAPEIDSFFVDL